MPALAPETSRSAPGGPSPAPDLNSFLAELLADQQKLQTPVTRAATAHSLQPSAWRAERFREIIPLSKPKPGEQYAFEVDLDSCSGCKACVSGCHSLNGLDHEETWRDIGVVYGLSTKNPKDEARNPNSSFGFRHLDFNDPAPDSDLQVSSFSPHPSASPFQQTITTACHHCADPGCLNGCPVVAYEKDPVTGIVRHLDDQCIGCSYCILKCPYDVPKYNERLGIVRKCDMCHGRLADGEAPACVQSCPTQAIKIVLVSTGSAGLHPTSESDSGAPLSAPRSSLDTLAAISGTDSSYTRPTTRYVSKKPLPEILRPADAAALRPQHAHAALIFLLTLTQLSLGLLISGLLVTRYPLLATNSAAAALFAAGLVASAFHLGQPLRAWRVFLGLRTSWLSREAVILGAAFPLVVLAALIPWLPTLLDLVPFTLPGFVTTALDLVTRHSSLVTLAAIGTTALGVFCSAMIYIDTRRRFWRPAYTFGRMGGTVAVAALAFVSPPLAAAALVAKLGFEALSLVGASPSARLQRGPLLGLLVGRLFTGGMGALLLALGEAPLGFVCFALGELLERTLYFRAVDSPKMPGLSSSAPTCPVH